MSCDSTPFLWCLPKETVSSRQRKALFYLGGSTIRVSAPASVIFTHIRPTLGGGGAGFWREARLKVSPAFSKAAGCRGGALARAPQSAESSLCSQKRRRGFQGEPSPGVPPFSLLFCVCADTLGGFRYLALRFDPISLVLAQRNGVEPPKKSAFLPWRPHHSRERCKSVDYTFLARLGEGLGGLTGRSSQLDAVGGDVGASSSWERRVGLNGCRGGTQKRVSLGLHPVSLRKSKEMEWNGQQGEETSTQENGAHVQGENKELSPRCP